MRGIPDTIAALHADRDTGELASLCRTHGIDLLVLFGSARQAPERAHDVDVAYSFEQGTTGDVLAVTNALQGRYGDYLDVMCLDHAGSVARYAALGTGEVLVELTATKFANSQMAAFGAFVDTQRLRDIALENLAR